MKMSYESPVEVIQTQIQNQIEEEIYRAGNKTTGKQKGRY